MPADDRTTTVPRTEICDCPRRKRRAPVLSPLGRAQFACCPAVCVCGGVGPRRWAANDWRHRPPHRPGPQACPTWSSRSPGPSCALVGQPHTLEYPGSASSSDYCAPRASLSSHQATARRFPGAASLVHRPRRRRCPSRHLSTPAAPQRHSTRALRTWPRQPLASLPCGCQRAPLGRPRPASA